MTQVAKSHAGTRNEVCSPFISKVLFCTLQSNFLNRIHIMKLCLALLSVIDGSQAFAPQSNSRATVSLFGGNPIANFFEELDNFIDDATSRRLGNGAAFYGKRKSSFYGENDSGKKRDNEVADPTEDYQGPSSSGYFKWMPDEDGQMRPVSKMKEKSLERNPKFWDRQFDDDVE